MEWKLDDGRPIWPQLSQQLARRILAGVYPPGSRLPAVRELAAEAGVNPNTMQRALAQLEQEGLAKADRTAGRLVTQDRQILESVRLREAQAVIQGYFEAMSALGYSRERAVELLKEEFQ
ncbi:MAG: GntR family transcriptional regulator [Lawsonibacter sp.]|nr:GntR family transcriptional regulator [Lawsonibacter sp.]